ncbi:MAG: FkbM family methyltransferase [Spartobacteria bacterium]
MNLLHLVRRKLATFAATIRACENWPTVARARLSASAPIDALHFRNGLKLRPMPPLQETWGEIFEPAIADLYGIRACQPDLIVDVGANIGAFTCLAAHAHPNAQVHAFEPSSPHADRLAENVALNCLGNVVLHRKAVTKDGRTVVFSQFGAGGASGIVLQGDGPSTELESVSLGTIDFGSARFLFLKLDCEGAEGEIIEWLCANLSRLPPRLQLACEYHHWCPLSSDQLLTLLRAHGFEAEPRTLFDEGYLFASRNQEKNDS